MALTREIYTLPGCGICNGTARQGVCLEETDDVNPTHVETVDLDWRRA